MGKITRFEVLTAVLMKIQVTLDVTPCSVDSVNPEGVAAGVYETSVSVQQTIRCHISEDLNLQRRKYG